MRKALIVTAALLLLASTARAQRPFGFHGLGPRGGVTVQPDQVHFGAHFDLGDLAPQLMLFPNIEIGVGDDRSIIAPMFELDFRFLKRWGSWNPYVGGGAGPVFVSHDNRGDDTEFGIAAQGGIVHRMANRAGFLFLEFKLGIIDYPDYKFTIGWSFGMGGHAKGRPQPAAGPSP